MTSHTKRALLAATALSCAALAAAPVQAQQDGEEGIVEPGVVLEEMVVTARMRQESLQDVPISVTAFSASQIEDARIDQVGDFINLTANMTVSLSQGPGISFITIRGIPQVRNGEPPVAVILDGVLQTNSRQFTRELFDIQSIEVLRGPQGALYGRNAIGGAVIVNTLQPTNEFDGHVRAAYATGEDYLVQGSVSGPIVEDTLLFRVGARYQDRAGYFRNINLNRKVDPFEDVTVTGQLTWMPSDSVTATLNGNLSRTDAGGTNFRYQPAILTADGTSLDTSLPFPFDFDSPSSNDADIVDRRFNATNIGTSDRDINEISLKLEYETDLLSVTSVTSYNDLVEFLSGDQFPYTAALTQPFLGGSDGGQTQFVDVRAWSQEVRVASSSAQRFRWMAGFYYLATDRFISTTVSDDRGQGLLRVEHDPFFDDPTNPTLSFLADDNDNDAWAVFGNAAYDLTERLELSVALRYDRDIRRQTVDPRSTSGVPGAVNRRTFDKLQPKVTLTYDVAEDAVAYGSWGVGFRSGQFNQNGVREAAEAAGVGGVDDFTPEEVAETFEVGFKSELLDNRLRLNGAAFYTQDKRPAYFVFVGSIGAQVLVPIDKVRLIGGELEAIARLAPGLDGYVALGITDSEVRAYVVNPDAVGNRAPYVPRTTFNAGLQYRTDLTERFALFARVDYERRGRQFWDPENTTDRSALDLVNARLGIEDPAGRWSLIGSVENLTDEVYNSEFVLGGFSHPAPPRIWSVDLRYNF